LILLAWRVAAVVDLSNFLASIFVCPSSQGNSVQQEYASNDNHGNSGGDDFPAEDDPFADNIFFAPAEHTESIKQRKERKRQERQQRRDAREKEKLAPAQLQQRSGSRLSSGGYQENEKPTSRGSKHSSNNSHCSSISNVPAGVVIPPDAKQLESRQGTPPLSSMPRDGSRHSRRPPKSSRAAAGKYSEAAAWEDREAPVNLLEDVDCDVWYAKWWLFCFPDAVDNMTERR
jgi:hypothetical protein